MTLSRYDTASGLYFEGNPNTAYQRAFFHPGVGMWQFDSAGLGASRYAAHFISTAGGGPQAAAAMASRYCAAGGTGAQRRAAAWAPWHACSSGACEAIFGEIYNGTNGQLRAISGTSTVSSRGGMVSRTCTRGGSTQVIPSCFYVDPAAAEGQDWWASPNTGASPITAPFYVFELGGWEYRVWLKEDTGYSIDIEAVRPLGQNARSSLEWHRSTALCTKVSTAQTFCDVSPTHPFFDEIEWVAAEDIAGGYADGDFKPAASVSRQAMAAFMYRLAAEDEPVSGPAHFSDVSPSHEFFTEIEWLVDEGVVDGYPDGTFRPLQPVSRQAMAAFMHRLAGSPPIAPHPTSSFSDVAVGRPFYDEIHWLADEQISEGYDDGTFRPDATVTRQAMAAFLMRLAEVL
jgi:hypothetical protein